MLRAETSSVPLLVLRVGFGLLMVVSTLRFIWNGWIDAFYVRPQFHFTYLGFGWVQPLPAPGLYFVYTTLVFCALAVALGWGYRVGIVGFFLLFTYTELLDKTYYLNHYYFVASLAFLLMWLPKSNRGNTVPAWSVTVVRLFLAMVYIYAGVAKLNSDWLVHAMPLKIWLAGNSDFPLVGRFFDAPWLAFAMSWAGALYDLTIPFFLLNRHTRFTAYLAVITFHLLTGLLFPIGMFPAIMIVCTLVFFEAEDWAWFRKNITPLQARIRLAAWPSEKQKAFWNAETRGNTRNFKLRGQKFRVFPRFCTFYHCRFPIIITFLLFQLLMPLRHWLYPGNLFWSEEGFRFAWHVMVAEKTGYVIFTARDSLGREWTLYPRDYLTVQQEKQMSFQPDMILQFAHFLAGEMRQQGIPDVAIYAEAYASLNGRPSQLLIDPTVDLTAQTHTLAAKPWILPLQQ